MERLILFLLKYRKFFILGIVLSTGIFAFYAWQITVDPSNESLLPQDDLTVRSLREFSRIFGSDEILVVALHAPQVFTHENLALLTALTDRISKVPDVTRVVSLVNFKDVRSDTFGPTIKIPYEEVLSHKKSLHDFASEMSGHPIARHLILSEDGRTTALLVNIARREGDPFYRKRIVEEIRRILQGLSRPGLDFYVAGIPVEVTDLTEYIRRDQRIFLPLILLTLTVFMGALYQTALEVAVPLVVVLTSLVWTLGGYVLNGKSLNAITTLLTPIVMVTSVENAIHFFNRYKEDLYEVRDRQKALVKSFSIIALPCFLTSFTTAVGFASLVVNPIPAVKDFGIYASLGAIFAYILAMTVVPLSIIASRIERVGGWRERRWEYMERLFQRLERILLFRKGPVLAVIAVLLIVSLVGLFRIKVSTDIIRSFKSTSPLYLATQFIDEHLTGVNSLEITLRAPPSPAPGSRMRLETLRKMEELQRFLKNFPEVTKTLSVVDLIKRLNQADHDEDPAFSQLPEDESTLEEYLDLMTASKDKEYLQFITEDLTLARISCRVKAVGTDRSQQMLRELQSYVNRTFQNGEEVHITGSMVVLSNMSTYLVRNQMKSMAAALPLILLSMGLLYRSVFVGLISAVPNLIPIWIVYGCMGWLGIELSVPTAMISSIVIGLAINNTIYFLSRFKLEFEKLKDYPDAIHRTLRNTGRAMISSSVLLILGFWVGVFGSFKPSMYFAWLTGMTLLMALISNLVILPLSLLVFKPMKSKREG